MPRLQGFELIARIDQHIALETRSKSSEQLQKPIRLVKRFAARNGHAVRLGEPGFHALQHRFDRLAISCKCPSVTAHAARAADRASLEPDADSRPGPSAVIGKCNFDSEIRGIVMAL